MNAKHESSITPGPFTFDGMGINGPDEYAPRLATLTSVGRDARVGPLLAAAPDLRKALEGMLNAFPPPKVRSPGGLDANLAHAAGRTALAKAKGEA